MANQIYTKTVEDYNYSREPVSVVRSRLEQYFDLEIAGLGNTGNYIKVVKNSVKTKTFYTTKEIVVYKKKKPMIITKDQVDSSIVIELGGTFEDIGGIDEAIGGGNQKVGTDN